MNKKHFIILVCTISALMIIFIIVYFGFILSPKDYLFETKDREFCNGSHKIIVSDTAILSAVETKIDNNNDSEVEGGCFASNYNVKVIGDKKGNASVLVEYYDISKNKIQSDTYYFNVDNKLNVNFLKIESIKNN